MTRRWGACALFLAGGCAPNAAVVDAGFVPAAAPTGHAVDAGADVLAWSMDAPVPMTEQKAPLHGRDFPIVSSEPPRQPDKPPPLPTAEPAPLADRPTSPSPAEKRPAPAGGCGPGTGWDFEELEQSLTRIDRQGHVVVVNGDIADLQGWSGGPVGSPWGGITNADLDLPAGPVYGNAAPIDRI